MAHMTFDVHPGQCFVHKICMLEIGSKDAAVGKWRFPFWSVNLSSVDGRNPGTVRSWFEYVQFFIHLKCLAGFLPSRIFYLIVDWRPGSRRYLSSTTWGSDKESWGMFFPHPKMESKTLGKSSKNRPVFRIMDHPPWTLHKKTMLVFPLKTKCYFCIHLPKKTGSRSNKFPHSLWCKTFLLHVLPPGDDIRRHPTDSSMRRQREPSNSSFGSEKPKARRNGWARREGSNPKEQRLFKSLGLLVYDGMFEMGLWNNPI